jgi:P27 family predicted phage terminase small subunit
MGKRGPKPTPTAVLKLRDSRRANLNRNEPKPEPGVPDPPEILDEEGLSVWNQLIPQLKAMGVLTKIDGLALSRYCVIWSQWVKATQFIQQHGTTYPLKDGNGKVKCFAQFPQVAIMHKTTQALSRLEAEFGLTPSARTRIDVTIKPPIDPNDPKANYVFGACRVMV